MKMDKMMCESKELEFAIFCIENIASRLHVDVVWTSHRNSPR